MAGLVLLDPNRLLPAAAARILGVTPAEIRRLVDAGRLPAKRVLGVRLIERTAVESLARDRKARKYLRLRADMR